MKKIIVFLRHNNDIDHISPIIYKWITTKNIPVDINITSKKEFLDDYRIKYLKEQVKSLECNDVHFYYFSKLKKTKSFLEHYFSENRDTLVCLDWNSDDFARRVYEIAKRNLCTVIALPHGDEPFWNLIQREEDINYAHSLQPYLKRSFFDYIVVPNQLCANHYKFMNQNEIKILGSPRYCDEWLKIHNQIKPHNKELSINRPLKVVLFLRNKHWNINWQEVATNIKLITQYNEIFLIVRNHPRGTMTYDLLKNHPWMRKQKNLLIDSEINSSVLMDWSDVILDLGTSVTWESVKNNKPTVMLEHLHANVTTIAHYMPKTIIHSRDELLDTLRKFYKNKKRKWCRESNRQKFINDIIDCPDNNVLERYCNFLESLINGN